MFFYPVLDALSDGRVIRRGVQGILKVSAWIMALLGVLGVIDILKDSFRAQDSLPTVGGVLFAIVVAASIACVFQIYYYRANSIGELRDSEYTVIPVVSILSRMTGEVFATIFTALAVGLCVQTLLGAPTTAPVSGFGPSSMWRSQNNFVLALSFLGWFLFLAFATIVFFYFVAEAVVVATDIARHTRRLAATAPPDATRSGARGVSAGPARSAPSARPAVPPPPAPTGPPASGAPPAATPRETGPVTGPVSTRSESPRCASCGAKNEVGSAFCAECGAAL